jgi:serine/threonine protein kinase
MNTSRLPGEQKAQLSAEGSLQPGGTLQNRYRITGVLGVGGMGSVYLARDMNFTEAIRNVAVKEMLNLNTDPGMRELMQRTFEREANILAELSHPAIPKIYDYFTSRDRAYLVMEYINGKDVEALINTMTDFLPFEMIRKWSLEMCDVLEYLHAHQPPIVFRDIKPSNIMIDSQGRIRLIDFGIAKAVQMNVNQKGTMIGTEGYSPPEQYRGEASPQGDIYALGATLHHIATRKDPRIEPPFSFHERPIRAINPKIPPEFERVVLRALEYQPQNRFPTAVAMRDALVSLGGTSALNPAAAPMPAAPAPRPQATIDFAASAPAAPYPPQYQQVPQQMSGQPPVVPMSHPSAPGNNAMVTPEPGFEEASIKEFWKFKCEDEIRGTPIFHKNVIYIGSYDNNLYAINSVDGSFRWKFATDGGVASTPIVSPDDNLVMFGSEDGFFYAVDIRTGKVNWTFQTGGPVRSSATFAGGHAFVGSDDGKLYAIRVSTGRASWKADLAAPMRSRPAVTPERIIVGMDNGDLMALDLTGNVKWRFKAKRSIYSWPVIENDIVYVGSMDMHVYAIDVNNGWALWRFRTNKGIVGSPLLVGKTLYIGSADNCLYAVDITNGRESWHFTAADQIVGSPAHAAGALYFGCVDKQVYSIETKKGKLRWAFPTGGPITSTPVIVDKLLFIGSTDHHLYALNL